MNYSNSILDEARLEKPWSSEVINSIETNAQSRYEAIKDRFHLFGKIATKVSEYEVWGEIDQDEARFYAIEREQCVGYLVLRSVGLPDKTMKNVTMVFVLPAYLNRGIAGNLYRFALGKGISIVSDATLTTKSKLIWQSMMKDPRIEVTLMSYDQHARDVQPQEKPLTSIASAFRHPQNRMIARLK